MWLKHLKSCLKVVFPSIGHPLSDPLINPLDSPPHHTARMTASLPSCPRLSFSASRQRTPSSFSPTVRMSARARRSCRKHHTSRGPAFFFSVCRKTKCGSPNKHPPCQMIVSLPGCQMVVMPKKIPNLIFATKMVFPKGIGCYNDPAQSVSLFGKSQSFNQQVKIQRSVTR